MVRDITHSTLQQAHGRENLNNTNRAPHNSNKWFPHNDSVHYSML